MRDGQWQLSYPGVDLTLGLADDAVFNRTTPDIGDVEIRTSDRDRPRTDGRAFGIDYRSGRTVTFDLGIRAESEAAVRLRAEQLSSAWRADAVRLTPGGIAQLRSRYSGRERVLYGRPRRLAPDYSDAAVNHYVTAIATFDVIDDVFYGDEDSVEFSITPSLGGGLTAPLASPLATTASSDRSAAIRVDTEVPVWPVVTIVGPVTNPVVAVAGVVYEARLSLAYDETLVIDTRPWRRTVLRNGVNVAGTVRGTRLSASAIAAGAYEVTFRGTDATGTARVRLAWSPAYSSL